VTIAHSATLRFYAELRDFLPGESRSGTVTRTFDVPGSVKDLIESCGVPHTEVALIIVDGRPVDFAHIVGSSERVAVYPEFRSIDTATIAGVLPDPLDVVRFVADGHLGRLVRFLRLLGFDTRYDQGWDDAEIAGIAAGEGRIVLTRDIGLLKRSIVTRGAFVRATDPGEQLTEIVQRFDLADRLEPFTRCVSCNGPLVPVPKAEIVDRLPPGTRRAVDDFHICTSCGHLYWRGAHFAALEAIVASARFAPNG
jgi:uncharacterized protein with PIN domain